MGCATYRRCAPDALLDLPQKEMHCASCAGDCAARIQEPLNRAAAPLVNADARVFAAFAPVLLLNV
jgi:hypothetical protein